MECWSRLRGTPPTRSLVSKVGVLIRIYLTKRNRPNRNFDGLPKKQSISHPRGGQYPHVRTICPLPQLKARIERGKYLCPFQVNFVSEWGFKYLWGVLFSARYYSQDRMYEARACCSQFAFLRGRESVKPVLFFPPFPHWFIRSSISGKRKRVRKKIKGE